MAKGSSGEGKGEGKALSWPRCLEENKSRARKQRLETPFGALEICQILKTTLVFWRRAKRKGVSSSLSLGPGALVADLHNLLQNKRLLRLLLTVQCLCLVGPLLSPSVLCLPLLVPPQSLCPRFSVTKPWWG